MRRMLRPRRKVVVLLVVAQVAVCAVYYFSSLSQHFQAWHVKQRAFTVQHHTDHQTSRNNTHREHAGIIPLKSSTTTQLSTKIQTAGRNVSLRVFSFYHQTLPSDQSKGKSAFGMISYREKSKAYYIVSTLKEYSDRNASVQLADNYSVGKSRATNTLVRHLDWKNSDTALARKTLSVAVKRIRCKTVSLFNDFSIIKYVQLATLNSSRVLPRPLLAPGRVCMTVSESGSPFLVVLVMSSYRKNSPIERLTIRTTYGSVVRDSQWLGAKESTPVRMMFVLGRPPTALHRQRVLTEFSQFGDLLVADFKDTYRNLTLKVLVGLQWVLDSCPGAKFVFKTDEDTFVNLPLLATFLLQRGRDNCLYGRTYRHNPVHRRGRWSVTRDAFPFLRYPLYMCGTGYVLSMDAVGKVVAASTSLQLIPVEDAFVGVVATVTKVTRMVCSAFARYRVSVSSPPCKLLLNNRFMANEIPAANKNTLWAKINRGDSLC